MLFRQGLKGGAMFLFERAQAAKGKNREPGLQENSVRSFTERQSLYWAFFIGIFANKNALVGTTTACCSVRD